MSTVSTTRRCIAQETFCELLHVRNVTIIIKVLRNTRLRALECLNQYTPKHTPWNALTTYYKYTNEWLRFIKSYIIDIHALNITTNFSPPNMN